MSMKRILAFGCHPDDVEYMCGGTLALLARAGCEIHIATMTGGEVGSPTLAPQAIRNVRLKEAAAGAAIIGAAYHYAGGCDLEVDYSPAYRKYAVRVLREVDPQVVFTHAPIDYLPDHEETSRLVRNAAFIAPVPNYDCGVPVAPTKKQPHLYYWNAMGLKDIFGRPLPIGMRVDITSVIDVKTKMLAAHASQRQWLKKISRIDEYLSSMRDQSRKEGTAIGARYAEGFIQHAGLGHPQDNILTKLLGPLCVEAG